MGKNFRVKEKNWKKNPKISCPHSTKYNLGVDGRAAEGAEAHPVYAQATQLETRE